MNRKLIALAALVGLVSLQTGNERFNTVLISTSGSSIPLEVVNTGSASSLKVSDQASDTTRFEVDSAGWTSINSQPVAGIGLNLGGTTNNPATLRVSDGTRDFDVMLTSSGGGTPGAQIGMSTTHDLQLKVADLWRLGIFVAGYLSINKQANPPTSIATGSPASYHLVLGDNQSPLNGLWLLGYGYHANTTPPSYVGYQETDSNGNTKGKLIFGTRNVTTDTAPTTRLTINADGSVDIPGALTVGSCSGCAGAGAGSQDIGITIDGGGSVITTGVKGFIRVTKACTITAATLLSTDASATAGSIVIDVWKDSYANYPPTVADTITASAKPTLSSSNKSEDTTLTGWTTSISAGNILGFNVDSASTVTRVTLGLTCTY